MKKALAGFLFAVLAASGTLHAQSDLLRNEGFETDTLDLLTFWLVDSYTDTDDARRVFTVDSPVHSGKRSLSIVNLVPNDTRMVQWVAVEPEQYYRITCWVRAENVSGAAVGANISVLGSITPSASVKDTADAWVRLELTGKTGPGQTAVAVSLRLGFYDNLVVGRAYFDDVAMAKISAPPPGVTVADWSSNRGTGMVYHRLETRTQAETRALPPPAATALSLAGAAALAAAFILGLLRAGKRPAGKHAVEPSRAAKRTAPPELRRSMRRSLRINVTVKKPLRGDDYKLVELKSVNISETGMFLRSDDLSLFGVDEKLELGAVYKRARYDLGAARVVRKQEIHRGPGKPASSGFGLEFVDTSEAQRKHIRALVL